MEKLTKLSSRLSNLRTLWGLKQNQMAEKMCISAPYLSELESGKKKDLSEMLARLISYEFLVTPEWVKTGVVNTVLAAKIQHERQRKYQYAKDAAADLGVPTKFLQAIEAGEISPSDIMLDKIATLYGVNKYQLLDNTLKCVSAVKSTGDDTLDREVAENMHVPSDIKEIEKLLLNDPDAVPLVKQLLIGRAAARELMKP
jgi:transcriptional regulator with XRE-family HTH domain